MENKGSAAITFLIMHSEMNFIIRGGRKGEMQFLKVINISSLTSLVVEAKR